MTDVTATDVAQKTATQTEPPDRVGPLYGGAPTPRVIIAGAGLGGIAQCVYLREKGIETFTVFEKSAGPGGTWWDNRYPGAACDVPSLLYSYSFHLVEWDKTHATQAEIQRYIEDVIDLHGFRDRLVFGVGVARAVWDRKTHTWDVTTTDGRHHECDVFISAVGMLNVPNEMKWPGLDTFEGVAVHSSKWRPEHDFTGKRVAVVGAGASAAQIVPTLAPTVEKLISYQREPGWVSPKNDHVLSDEERARFSSIDERRRERANILKAIDSGLRVGAEPDGETARTVRSANEAYVREALKDRPELIDVLTPDYALRCKRAVLSNSFLQTLTRPNVEFVPRAVTAVTPTGVVDSEGVEREVDAIVMATGFQTTNFLSTMEVVGKHGTSIRDVWTDGAEAFLGITVPGFPNFYMLYGPNTHGTVVTYVLECQAEYAAKDVARLARAKATSIEVRRSTFDWFQRKLQSGIAEVVAWTAGCHNYYLTASGKNVVQWPWSHTKYRRWTRLLRVPSSRMRTLRAPRAMQEEPRIQKRPSR